MAFIIYSKSWQCKSSLVEDDVFDGDCKMDGLQRKKNSPLTKIQNYLKLNLIYKFQYSFHRMLNSRESITDSVEQAAPEFIQKLYTIIQNKDYHHVISWSKNGTQVQIKNSKWLQEYILPKYFRHSNTKSFVRQLNMYGFNKTYQMSQQKKHIFFKNQDFQKGQQHLFKNIKRKRKGEQQHEEKPQSHQNSKPHQKDKYITQIAEQLVRLRSNHPYMASQMNRIFYLVEKALKEEGKQIKLLTQEKIHSSNTMHVVEDIPHSVPDFDSCLFFKQDL